jgi:aspartate carbamoyltransferase catalytic subunit
MKALLGIRDLGGAELERLVNRASYHATRFPGGRAVEPSLVDVTVGMLFFEPSTRTRLSFELASRRLSAEVMVFDPEQSSMNKGETVQDTVLTVAAIGMDVLVVRHGEVGMPERVHGWTGRPVINAGDGISEHPTQAIADCLTLLERFGALAGLRIGVVGDILHSRVAGSLLHALPILGAEVVLVGPEELLPETDHPSTSDLDEVIDSVDVVYLLRLQKERGTVADAGYERSYQLDEARAARMKPSAVVMHPGPINRGVEIAGPIADGPRSLILRQVTNGVPARMAALEAVAGVAW